MSVRALPAVVVSELRRRSRDRSVLLLGLVAPIALALIMSSAFGRFPTTASVAIGIVPGDPQVTEEVSTAFTAPALAPIVTLRRYDDEQSARKGLTDHDVDAVLTIPRDASPNRGEVAPVAVAGRDPIRDATARIIIQHVLTRTPEAVIDTPVRGDDDQPISFFAPSMGVLFAFLLAGVATRALVEERQLGTLQRVASTPAGAGIVLAGKLVAIGLVGVACLLALCTITTVGMGAHWGSATSVVIVSVGVVAAATGVMGVVAAIARSDEQAQSLGSVVAFTLAIVGGNFLEAQSLPATLRTLAPLTPNRWALQAFDSLSDGNSPDLVVPVLALGGFAATAVLLMSTRLRWSQVT